MGIWDATSKLFSDALAAILDGTPFGAVWPPKDDPPPPGEDGRTHALRALRLYLMNVRFQDPTKPGRVMQLEQQRIQLEQPETPKNLLFPSIAFVEGESELRPIGLTPDLDDSTFNVFAPGTALERSYEYAEQLTIEVWADTRAMRRTIMGGLERALNPSEGIGGLRLRMPQFFNGTVRFTFTSSSREDGELAGDRRRKGILKAWMEFEVPRLVNVSTMKPQAIVVADDPTAPAAG